jgi:hypothetical protein
MRLGEGTLSIITLTDSASAIGTQKIQKALKKKDRE